MELIAFSFMKFELDNDFLFRKYFFILNWRKIKEEKFGWDKYLLSMLSLFEHLNPLLFVNFQNRIIYNFEGNFPFSNL